jgi:SAM-dependent methyltransferase
MSGGEEERAMDEPSTDLVHDGTLSVDALRRLAERPAPFAPGAPRFWDDPHISASMLAAHLDPGKDGASRRADVIDRSVAWLLPSLGLRSGDALLDLGCGPGLYAERFACAGVRVTGIDLSRRSIEYARDRATQQHLAIDYIHGDYLEIAYRGAFDAAALIYGDLCALAPASRDLLLRAVHRALKEGGRFALDVTTPRHHADTGALNRWEVRDGGFWRPHPHLVLTQGFAWPADDLYLEQYIVIEASGATTVYRNWFQDYIPATITALLEGHGFRVESVWGDLTGRPYDGAEWIGILARKGETAP